jgi:hypothetical protein
MNTVAVQLPEALYRRAEAQAVGRGASVEALVQEVLEEYLEEREAPPPLTPIEQWRREAPTLAEAARAEALANGEQLLDWEALAREVAERRGGYQDTDE